MPDHNKPNRISQRSQPRFRNARLGDSINQQLANFRTDTLNPMRSSVARILRESAGNYQGVLG